MKRALTTFALAVLAMPVGAQTHRDHGSPGHSPYAGMEQRAIKALSPEQVKDLSAGRGMSLALAAELNGYPGPRHVLELAEQLELTPGQRVRTQTLEGDMQRNAVALGARVIEAERRLDALFALGAATREAVRGATAEVGASSAELRALHLSYHLEMMAVLTPEQVARYNALRGYRSGAQAHARH